MLQHYIIVHGLCASVLIINSQVLRFTPVRGCNYSGPLNKQLITKNDLTISVNPANLLC